MEELQTISTLQGVEIALRKELKHIAEGYIKVGYLLKKTRDAEFYKEKGYADVFEFAKETFNISRTWAIRFMQINNTYSIDGNSPEIQEKYRGYGSSKLSEMLALPGSGTKGCNGAGNPGCKRSHSGNRRSLFAADEPVRHRTRRTPWKLDGNVSV